MIGTLSLPYFLLCGALIVWALAPRWTRAMRTYFGLSLGMALMMWLPSLFAFGIRFNATTQFLAMGVAAILAALAWAWRFIAGRGGRTPAPAVRAGQHPPLKLTLALLVPFLAVSAYLLHTHTLRPMDGALHVGQSTFGDLSLHLGIATGLRDAAYPPEYTLLPGTLLGYPFLMDAAAGTMLVLGASLRASFLLTSLVAMALVGWGFAILSWRLTHSGRATAVSFLLMFLNGGLGFLYMLDGWPSDPSRLLDIFTGFYLTPSNLPDLNLRWSNVLCDLMVPQRTLLAGWMMVMMALILLHEALRERRLSIFAMLGVWAGMMPMVHTHSFLALGLISLGAMGYSLLRGAKHRRRAFWGFALYGGIAVLLALPQLIGWTFPQTLGGESLRFRFNWVNTRDDGSMIDGYFWFWIKNVGPVYLLMVPAALARGKRHRALAAGALCVYVVAELFQFQPNAYDNNKLFYVAFLLMLPMVSGYLVNIYDRLSGMPGRRLIAGAFLCASLLSGALSVGRELVSDYELFSADEAAAAVYVDEHAAKDAVFATGTQHNNPVSSLAGRTLVCGTPTFLYFHGVDYSEQRWAVRQMYEQPAQSAALFEQYDVDYVYVSSYERGEFDIDYAGLDALFPLWYTQGAVRVYAVDSAAIPNT